MKPIGVELDGGPTVFAMCAVDALGMSTMLGRSVNIHASEPGTGYEITIEVDGDHAGWWPATAVVFAGATADCCASSAVRTCGYINFFITSDAARRWAADRSDLDGVLLDQDQALACGIAEFVALLAAPDATAAQAQVEQDR